MSMWGKYKIMVATPWEFTKDSAYVEKWFTFIREDLMKSSNWPKEYDTIQMVNESSFVITISSPGPSKDQAIQLRDVAGEVLKDNDIKKSQLQIPFMKMTSFILPMTGLSETVAT